SLPATVSTSKPLRTPVRWLSPGEIDDIRVATAEQHANMLTRLGMILPRQQGGEGGRATRLCDNAGRRPQRFLSHEDLLVTHQDRVRYCALRDRKHECAHLAGSQRISCDPARWRINRMPGLQGEGQGWGQLWFHPNYLDRVTIPACNSSNQSTATHGHQERI